MSEGFFSRWSRRKQEAGQETQPAAPASVPEPQVQTPAPSSQGHTSALQRPEPEASRSDATALPTLDDVQALTPESDFQPFMQRGVDAPVRNAAMKKLFADPHFNVMDGLDIYIDDYSQPDPMPVGMLAKMASAQFLKLVPEHGDNPERPAQDPLASAEPVSGGEVVAQSPDSSVCADTASHDHPDLQLQPDLAPAGPQPEPGPR